MGITISYVEQMFSCLDWKGSERKWILNIISVEYQTKTLLLVWLSICKDGEKKVLLPVSASLPLVCEEYSLGWCTFLTASPLESPLTPFFGESKLKNITRLKMLTSSPQENTQFIDWYQPFPVKYFRKWQNVGVCKDDRDTTSLQYVTEGSLAETSPTQYHAEWGFLYIS